MRMIRVCKRIVHWKQGISQGEKLLFLLSQDFRPSNVAQNRSFSPVRGASRQGKCFFYSARRAQDSEEGNAKCASVSHKVGGQRRICTDLLYFRRAHLSADSDLSIRIAEASGKRNHRNTRSAYSGSDRNRTRNQSRVVKIRKPRNRRAHFLKVTLNSLRPTNYRTQAVIYIHA